MTQLWMKGGQIVGSGGNPIDCANCPCPVEITESSHWHWTDTNVGLDSATNLEVGDLTFYGAGGSNFYLGFSVPVTGTVSSAVIKVASGSDPVNQAAGTVKARIIGVAMDNAISFDHRTVARTSAYVDWTIPTYADSTVVSYPDASSVVNEILARPGWVAGNRLVLMVINNGSDTNKVRRAFWSSTSPEPYARSALVLS